MSRYKRLILPIVVCLLLLLGSFIVNVIYFRTADTTLAASQMTMRSDVYIESNRMAQTSFVVLDICIVLVTILWSVSRFLPEKEND